MTPPESAGSGVRQRFASVVLFAYFVDDFVHFFGKLRGQVLEGEHRLSADRIGVEPIEEPADQIRQQLRVGTACQTDATGGTEPEMVVLGFEQSDYSREETTALGGRANERRDPFAGRLAVVDSL